MTPNSPIEIEVDNLSEDERRDSRLMRERSEDVKAGRLDIRGYFDELKLIGNCYQQPLTEEKGRRANVL